MKPKEFDELIRQKFDQNDFPYESRNWDKLADQLDGRNGELSRTKKRSMMIWWMMPLAGIAASVAMAFGVTFFYQQSQKGLGSSNTAFNQHNNNGELSRTKKQATVQPETGTATITTTQQYPSVIASGMADLHVTKTKNNITIFSKKKTTEETFAISLENAVGFSAPTRSRPFIFNDELMPTKDKKMVGQNEGFTTFKPEDEEYKKPTKNSITITGGVNHGNENSGYMLGTNLRHMINDKLFIESDVAFANSSNSQTTQVLAPTAGSSGARQAAAGRITASESSRPLNTESAAENVENENQSYTLYYAQVTPGLGYKVMNNMSLGLGPDFQQMLVDNRPAQSTVDRNNIAVAPMFDVGFVGKTEYALTKKVKAGVSYRKGINNLLTPMDKYIDRDYLQFQLKCTVFNK